MKFFFCDLYLLQDDYLVKKNIMGLFWEAYWNNIEYLICHIYSGIQLLCKLSECRMEKEYNATVKLHFSKY